MATVGRLTALISANTGAFERKLGQAGRVTSHFAGGLRSALKSVTGFGTQLIALAGVGGFGILIKRNLESIDKLGKLSTQLGVNVEELQKLRHAADQTGAGAAMLDAGLATLAKRVGEAAQGSGMAKVALQQLGLPIKDLARMSPDQMFRKIAGAMQAIESPAQRAAIAAGLFSKRGMALLNTLDLGEEGLDAMGADLERLGGVFSTLDTEHAAAAIDAIDRIKKAAGGMAGRLAIEVAPLVTLFGEKLATSIGNTSTAAQTAEPNVGKLSAALTKIADVVDVVVDGFRFLQSTFSKTIGGMASGLAGFYDMLSRLPGKAGQKYAQAARGVHAFADEMNKTAAAQWTTAMEGFTAKTPSEEIGSMNSALGTTKENALDAAEEMLGLADAVTKAAGGLEALGEKFQVEIETHGMDKRTKEIYMAEKRLAHAQAAMDRAAGELPMPAMPAGMPPMPALDLSALDAFAQQFPALAAPKMPAMPQLGVNLPDVADIDAQAAHFLADFAALEPPAMPAADEANNKLRELADELDKLDKRAEALKLFDRLKEELESPLEKYIRKMTKLDRLAEILPNDKATQTTLARAAEQLEKDYAKSIKKPQATFAADMRTGSAEAYKAIMQGKFGPKDRTADAVKEARKHTSHLQHIEMATEESRDILRELEVAEI